jgi:hypothetical protein
MSSWIWVGSGSRGRGGNRGGGNRGGRGWGGHEVGNRGASPPAHNWQALSAEQVAFEQAVTSAGLLEADQAAHKATLQAGYRDYLLVDLGLTVFGEDTARVLDDGSCGLASVAIGIESSPPSGVNAVTGTKCRGQEIRLAMAAVLAGNQDLLQQEFITMMLAWVNGPQDGTRVALFRLLAIRCGSPAAAGDSRQHLYAQWIRLNPLDAFVVGIEVCGQCEIFLEDGLMLKAVATALACPVIMYTFPLPQGMLTDPEPGWLVPPLVLEWRTKADWISTDMRPVRVLLEGKHFEPLRFVSSGSLPEETAFSDTQVERELQRVEGEREKEKDRTAREREREKEHGVRHPSLPNPNPQIPTPTPLQPPTPPPLSLPPLPSPRCEP